MSADHGRLIWRCDHEICAWHLSINNNATALIYAASKVEALMPLLILLISAASPAVWIGYPSVAASGVSDISLYEMMGAYSMFPSGGMNTQPFLP